MDVELLVDGGADLYALNNRVRRLLIRLLFGRQRSRSLLAKMEEDRVRRYGLKDPRWQRMLRTARAAK
jgi:hypothetical protein